MKDVALKQILRQILVNQMQMMSDPMNLRKVEKAMVDSSKILKELDKEDVWNEAGY